MKTIPFLLVTTWLDYTYLHNEVTSFLCPRVLL